MKNAFFFALLFISTVLGSCALQEVDELSEVRDSLSYENIIGTYRFNPTKFQAEKLNLHKDAVITLKITSDSLEKKKSGVFSGKYFIDNMILTNNWETKSDYSSKWVLSYIRETQHNRFDLYQNLTHVNNISFQLEKRATSDTLHIVGYTSDPKFEVLKIVDFKKVNDQI